MKRTVLSCSIVCILLLWFPLVWSMTTEVLDSTGGKIQFSFEALTLPENEKMGLLGGAFLYDVNKWLSMGIASYGALSGDRGGFITLGLASELKIRLNRHLDLNTGFFVGAGGGRGGFTLQGGGLMLRPHLGLHLQSERWGDVGVGISHVRFPNGNINSSQPYLVYAYPFEVLIAGAWLEKKPFTESSDHRMPASERKMAAVYRTYIVPDDVLTDGGNPQHPTINLIGVEWIHAVDKHRFLKIESEGAMGGDSNGYMQILLGGGYQQSLSESTLMKIEAQIGVAGGGSVATGGGLLVDVSLGLQQDVSDALYLGVAGGLVDAPDGHFRATSLSLQLGHRYGAPLPWKEPVKFLSLADHNWQHLRLRTAHQTYFEGRSTWRNHHTDENVDLLGFQGDYFIGENLYLSGQGLAAYEGNAGGYMTGLWGLGIHLPLFHTPGFIGFEGLVGAAGGGGLDVAGGFVWQGNVGLGYLISKEFSLIGSWGYMSAPKGNFRAKVVGFSIAYHFTIFTNNRFSS